MITRIQAKDVQPGMITPFAGYLWRVTEVLTGQGQPLGLGLLVEAAGEAAGRFKGFVMAHKPGDMLTVQTAA